MTLNDLEIETAGFSDFLANLGRDAHLKSVLSPKLLEVDQDNLRMKLNRSCRAPHEHWLRFLVFTLCL